MCSLDTDYDIETNLAGVVNDPVTNLRTRVILS